MTIPTQMTKTTRTTKSMIQTSQAINLMANHTPHRKALAMQAMMIKAQTIKAPVQAMVAPITVDLSKITILSSLTPLNLLGF
jgi:hypothetical protein